MFKEIELFAKILRNAFKMSLAQLRGGIYKLEHKNYIMLIAHRSL